MQFTGFYDRRSKEIYEGDILASKFGVRSEVHWKGSAWRYGHASSDLRLEELCDDGKHTQDFEVIGNIYENPEFLQN
jgi:hypothetical protein